MTETKKPTPPEVEAGKTEPAQGLTKPPEPKKIQEIGGPPGPEPTRYGDWQFNGKVTDF